MAKSKEKKDQLSTDNIVTIAVAVLGFAGTVIQILSNNSSGKG